MTIQEIRLLPLRGATPDGGWDEKLLDPDNNLHTLVEVITDEGVTGLGSVWFEELLRPDDLEGYVKLTENAPLPIAGCEVFTRRQSFTPWIERGAVDHIQPDVTKVGWDPEGIGRSTGGMKLTSSVL